jgi:O-antigen/teichoic acid export membrane protein
MNPDPQGVCRSAPETGSAAATDTAAMDKHLLGGIAWSAAAKWGSQMLTWLSLLLVARLLEPRDFGVVGVAGVYLGLIAAFSEFGFGSAVITLRSLTASDIAQINTFSVISGAVGFLVSCALAIPMGWFFRSPELPAVIIVMSTNFLILGFKTVPSSVLQKDLRFKRLSLIDSVAAIVQSLCVLLLAWLGRGYWALALGSVVGTAVATALNVASRPWGYERPRLKAVSHAVNFSWQILMGRLSWLLYSDADFLVAGRVLGTTALGAYTFAWNLATLPVEKVTALVGQVTPAFFSANQGDYNALRRYLLSLTEAVSLLTFPATIGLGLVAPEFIRLVLGNRWSDAVGPLEVLAFYGSIRSVSALLGPLLTALRETRLVMWTHIAAAVFMPLLFYVGSRWGPLGIACGWIVGYPFVVLPLYRQAFRKVGMPFRKYFAAIRPALDASLLMIFAVLALKLVIPIAWPLYLRFAIEVVAGAVAYLMVLLVLHIDRLRSFIDFYRRLRTSKTEAVGA